MEVAGYSFSTTNCAFSAFSCYSAIMLNSITIHAIKKTSSLPKSLKTLLLSLAVSDLGVGLLVLPLRVSLLIMHLEPNIGTNPVYNHTNKRVSHPGEFTLLCFVLWCHGSHC